MNDSLGIYLLFCGTSYSHASGVLLALRDVPGPVTDAGLWVEEEPVHAGHGVLQAVLALAEVRAALALGEQPVLHTVVVGAARGRWWACGRWGGGVGGGVVCGNFCRVGGSDGGGGGIGLAGAGHRSAAAKLHLQTGSVVSVVAGLQQIAEDRVPDGHHGEVVAGGGIDAAVMLVVELLTLHLALPRLVLEGSVVVYLDPWVLQVVVADLVVPTSLGGCSGQEGQEGQEVAHGGGGEWDWQIWPVSGFLSEHCILLHGISLSAANSEV